MFANPSVEVAVTVYFGVYLLAAKAMRQRLRTYQLWALLSAGLLLIFTLDGPIERLEDAHLFVAHMVQHLMLALVVPPLLIIATPAGILRPLLKNGLFRSLMRWATYPLSAYLLYSLTLVGIHSPRVFELMCRNDGFHIAMHLLLLATAVLLWWPLLSPTPELPRLSYPSQMLYLFLWLLPMSAIGAPITMATTVLYPWYAHVAHPFGLSPLSDQVLGGLAMWVGAGFYMIAVFTTIFFQWARYEDRDEPELGLFLSD